MTKTGYTTRPKALVAEDNPRWRQVLCGWCRDAGFDPDGVETSREIFSRIKTDLYQVAILDVFLDSPEVTEIRPIMRALRAAPFGDQLAVAIVTGLAETDVDLCNFGYQEFTSANFAFYKKTDLAKENLPLMQFLRRIEKRALSPKASRIIENTPFQDTDKH